MTYDPKNQHYDPYTAPPVFDSQPVTGAGYPDGGYPDSPPPQQQQAGYPGQYQYAQSGAAYNPAGYTTPAMPMYQAPENGVGVAALVLGILGIVACGLCAIPAVICGHMGIKKADRGQADNRSLAQAGLIMGYIGVGFLALALLFVLLYVIAGIAILGSAPSASY